MIVNALFMVALFYFLPQIGETIGEIIYRCQRIFGWRD